MSEDDIKAKLLIDAWIGIYSVISFFIFCFVCYKLIL